MKIVMRRSPSATAIDGGEEALAENIDIDDIHALLYRHGAMDLADAMAATLTPPEACAVARRLRRLVYRTVRHRFFRDYRTALHSDEAARLGLVALWYERAGQAGCRVWADLRPDPTVTPHLVLVDTDTPAAETIEEALPDASASSEPTRLMPDWLTAPEASVWSA